MIIGFVWLFLFSCFLYSNSISSRLDLNALMNYRKLEDLADFYLAVELDGPCKCD